MAGIRPVGSCNIDLIPANGVNLLTPLALHGSHLAGHSEVVTMNPEELSSMDLLKALIRPRKVWPPKGASSAIWQNAARKKAFFV